MNKFLAYFLLGKFIAEGDQQQNTIDEAEIIASLQQLRMLTVDGDLTRFGKKTCHGMFQQGINFRQVAESSNPSSLLSAFFAFSQELQKRIDEGAFKVIEGSQPHEGLKSFFEFLNEMEVTPANSVEV